MANDKHIRRSLSEVHGSIDTTIGNRPWWRKMLSFFGITKVKLLTNNPRKIGALVSAGIEVERERHQLAANPHNLRYLKTKASKSGHLLDFEEQELS